MASAIINRTQVPVYATGQWAFPANDDEVMVLHTLTVDPICGGRGIGRQFVAFYEDYALREGCSILRLDTNAVNSIDYTADADIGIDDVAEDAVGDMLKDVGTQHRHDEDTEAEARGRNTGS
jgi:GNAT superfamily N-acetyltransferase